MGDVRNWARRNCALIVDHVVSAVTMYFQPLRIRSAWTALRNYLVSRRNNGTRITTSSEPTESPSPSTIEFLQRRVVCALSAENPQGTQDLRSIISTLSKNDADLLVKSVRELEACSAGNATKALPCTEITTKPC